MLCDSGSSDHEIGRLLQRLNLEQYTQAFEEEEITELYLLRSMGDQLCDNLAQLGLDESAAQAVCRELLLAKGTKVRISGLQSQPALNNTIGTVHAFNGESDRYAVKVASGKVILLRASALTQTSELAERMHSNGESSISAAGVRPPPGGVISLWLVTADRGLPILHDGGSELGRICSGEVVEAWLPAAQPARLDPSEAARLLSGGSQHDDACSQDAEECGSPEAEEARLRDRYQRQHAERRRHWAKQQHFDVACFIYTDSPGVVPFGGRLGGPSGELWFARHHFASLLSLGRTLTPPWTAASPTRLHEVNGRPVASSPPLRTLPDVLTDARISQLIEHGYVVIDHALPPELCRQLKAEMEQLELKGQMWDSRTYEGAGGDAQSGGSGGEGRDGEDDGFPGGSEDGDEDGGGDEVGEGCRVCDDSEGGGGYAEGEGGEGGEDYVNTDGEDGGDGGDDGEEGQDGQGEGGVTHEHVHETSLDFKRVRELAPTFALLERDPSLLEAVRGVPGLEALDRQHVRLQINAGHGGCYSLHTDAGKRIGGDGQTLRLTALFYLNADWQPADGGELRVFPWPYEAEVIAPLEGRLVLFEPRMVHDVLPNFRKRFCVTLWCSHGGEASARLVDHATLNRIEVRPSVIDAAAVAERWRRAHCQRIAFAPSLPRCVRPLFLPEMRMGLVRVTHADDELTQLQRSHAPGATLESMLEAIAVHHEMVRASSPRWLLELLHQLPAATKRTASDASLRGGSVMRLAELQTLVHCVCPWWTC